MNSQAFKEGQSVEDENFQQMINNYWTSTLSVTGFEGLPPFDRAGNVVYKELKMRCSLRLPPGLTAKNAGDIVRAKLTEKRDEETYNADIEVIIGEGGNGFDAPKLPEEIQSKFFESHHAVFGEQNPPMFIGCGGSIPFMEVFE